MAPVNQQRNGRLGTFQSRGLLTKIGTAAGTPLAPGATSSTLSTSLRTGAGAGGGARNVPRPVNTSSLRKENGGQDITAVLVNRHGGKKVGWGSSLAENKEKVETTTTTDTSTEITTNNTATPRNYSVPTSTTTSSRRSLDPTPEEALASEKKSDPDGKTQQSPTNDQNAPWAFHQPAQPPSPSSRDMMPSNSDYPPSLRDRDYPEPGRDDQYSRRGSSNGYNNYHRDQHNNSRYYRDSSHQRDGYRGGYESNYNSRGRFDRGSSPPSDHYDRRDYPHNDGPPPSRRYDDRAGGDRGGPDDNYGSYNRGGYGGGRSRYNDGYSNNYSRDRYSRNDDRRHGDYYDRRGGDGYYKGDYGDERGGYGRYRDDRHVRAEEDHGGSRDDRYGSRYNDRQYNRSDNGRDSHSRGDDMGERGDYRSTTREGNEYRRSGRHTWSEDDPKDNENVEEQEKSEQHQPSPSREDGDQSGKSNDGSVDGDNQGPKRILKHGSDNGSATADPVVSNEKESIQEEANGSSNQVETVLDTEENTTANLVSDEEKQMHPHDAQVITNDVSRSTNIPKDSPVEEEGGDDDISYGSSGESIQGDDTSDEDINAVEVEKPTREQMIIQQQQNILRQVQAARLEKAQSSSFADEIERSASVASTTKSHPAVKNIQKSPRVEETKDDEKEDDAAAIQEAMRSKEEFLAKRAEERAARALHRRTRKPRTRGVLFKRLEDGTIVNADLTEEERTMREERRLKREAQKLAKSNRPPKHDMSRRSRNGNNEQSTSKEVSNDDNNDGKTNATNDTENKESKPLTPSPGPSVSAWVAGPPAGMVKRQEDSKNLTLGATGKNSTRVIEDDDQATKLDKVLSSSLLDIGNNSTSWSSPSSTKPTKTAVGPIMSSWSEFAGTPAGFDYESFTGTKPENKIDSTPVNGADWTTPLPDYALPRDLLSNGADSEDDISNTPVDTAKKEFANNKNRHSRKPYRGKKTQNSSGPNQNKKRYPRSNDGKRNRAPHKTNKVNKEIE